MKKTFIFSILFFFCSYSALISQNNPASVENPKHSIGTAAGFTTGYGISYRFWPEKFGTQVTFAPYFDESTKQFSAGVAFLYRLKKFEKTSFFLYQGNHLYYDESFWSYDGQSDRNQYGRHFHGLGFGFEIRFLQRLSFNLMGGYATFRYLDETTWQLNMTGEAGLFFMF